MGKKNANLDSTDSRSRSQAQPMAIYGKVKKGSVSRYFFKTIGQVNRGEMDLDLIELNHLHSFKERLQGSKENLIDRSNWIKQKYFRLRYGNVRDHYKEALSKLERAIVSKQSAKLAALEKEQGKLLEDKDLLEKHLFLQTSAKDSLQETLQQRVEFLETENQRLAAAVTPLNAENKKLKSQLQAAALEKARLLKKIDSFTKAAQSLLEKIEKEG